MKNYDQYGKEVTKGYTYIMNDNNGFALVPDGTTQAKLSNGDIMKTTLMSRVTAPGTPDSSTVTPTTTPTTQINPDISTLTNPSIPDPTVQPSQPQAKVTDMIMGSSVRISVTDPNGASHGSGTIIGEDNNGNVIIATCGHLFRDSNGVGPIKIDTFSPQESGSSQGVVTKSGIPATLISYDSEVNDIGIISVPKSELGNFQSARIAPQGFNIAPGQSVFTAGCSNGQACTILSEQVAGVNKFVGGSNIETSVQAVEGRSGGGLFNQQGVMIGVENAADPQAKQSVHKNIDLIRQMLQKNNIAMIK